MAQPVGTFTLRSMTVAALAIAAFALAGCGGSGGSGSGGGGSGTGSGQSSSPTATASSSTAPTGSVAVGGKPAQAPPASYQWVGIPAEQAWIAVPDSWVVLNPNDMSLQQAIARAKLSGLAATAMRDAFSQIKANHGIIVADSASVATSPEKFLTNINMFCTVSPIEPGPGAATTIASSMRTAYAKIGGHVMSVRKVSDTASAVTMQVDVNLTTPTGLMAHELQYVEVTNQGRLCYLTFSTDRQVRFFPLFKKIAATLHVG